MAARKNDIVAYHVTDIVVRKKSPTIGPLHVEFFQGTRIDDDPSSPFRIFKNVHRKPLVSVVDGTLLVAEPLMDEVRSVSECGPGTSVSIESTYNYPFAPGDVSYRNDSAYSYNIKSYARIAMRFCKKYSCTYAYPHRLIAVDMPVSQEGAADSLKCQTPCLTDEGDNGWEFEFSPSEIMTRGVVRAFGVVVSPAVWRILGKHLTFPYFIAHAIDINGRATRVPLN